MSSFFLIVLIFAIACSYPGSVPVREVLTCLLPRTSNSLKPIELGEKNYTRKEPEQSPAGSFYVKVAELGSKKCHGYQLGKSTRLPT